MSNAVASEAYLKLRNTAGFTDRTHFLRAAALAMRHVLVNYARDPAARFGTLLLAAAPRAMIQRRTVAVFEHRIVSESADAGAFPFRCMSSLVVLASRRAEQQSSDRQLGAAGDIDRRA